MAGPPPIFEPQRDRAGDRAISERRRCALEGRRLGKASPARDLPAWHRLGQRDRAMDASRPAEKIERRPAAKTELAIVADDDAATRATRGQRIIDDRARRGAQTAEPCPGRRVRFFGIPRRPCHRRVVKHRRGRHKRRMSQAPRSLFSPARSEEHTSELQSLMRISYAVFCLKKNNTTTSNYNHYTTK